MLHIWKASGELLQATPANELSDVRALKRQLCQLTGVPRFRQRKDSAILEDAARLDGPADLQLLQLPFCSTSYKQVIELHEAVENGNVSVVEDILQRPQNPELQLEDGSDWDSDEDGSVLDDYRHAPLTVASRAGRTEIVEMLLEAGADQDGLFELNRHDAYTPLCAACDCGSQEIVNLLLKSAAQPNGISKNGATKPLCEAARSGWLNIVRTLLEANADKDAKDAAGETALCKASRHGHLNVAIFLLDVRADVDAVSEVGDELAWHPNRFGEAPISAASEMGHVDVVRFLLSAHAFVEARNAKCRTPLWTASFYGHLETARLLLNAFAEPDVFDRHGRTPLCAACLAGHLSVAALLVDVGADRDAFDELQLIMTSGGFSQGHDTSLGALYGRRHAVATWRWCVCFCLLVRIQSRKLEMAKPPSSEHRVNAALKSCSCSCEQALARMLVMITVRHLCVQHQPLAACLSCGYCWRLAQTRPFQTTAVERLIVQRQMQAMRRFASC
ncbi:ANKHD1 [Symbiodinium necroappetens]|uniref:ANKHD1 protein n=1 Tax=Symbiodinium necroappetens TaxID=1628268 RepID=A0A812MGP8_9DINO|nr:ANKHD1 [Symbiodinium necroappetens]